MFLHSTPLNKINLEWAIYPIKLKKKSILTWYVLHLKNWLSAYNTKNSNKIDKINNFKNDKDSSEGTVSMSMYFSADWNLLRYRRGSTFVFVTNSQTCKHFCHWLFRSPEDLKSLQTNFRLNGEKKLWNLDTVIHPSDV